LFREPLVASRYEDTRVPLVDPAYTLQSMRDAGFDLSTAAGEAVDNAIEASASLVRITMTPSRDKKSIETIAFADNGAGVSADVLARILCMGYSTRYAERKGLGRFGVGLKLAGLSVGRRIEVYSRAAGSAVVHSVYIDLDEIASGDQQHIGLTQESAWPVEFRDLMARPQQKGVAAEPFASGTLILFRKIDRLRSGGTFASALSEHESDLRKYLGRTYRRFLAKGLEIDFNNKPVVLHDPLFLLESPRQRAKFGALRGVIIDETNLEVAGHSVHVTVAIVPERLRPYEGAGGNTDVDGKDIRELQIKHDNSGRLSMLRNGREIYYEIVPKLLPGGIDKVDRYLAIEVTFPGELDEYFQVRNVKRGAEPVRKLREELRKWLERPVRAARREIRRYWGTVENKKRRNEPSRHGAALSAANDAERDAPRGQAELDLSPEARISRIEEVVEAVLGENAAKEVPEDAERVRRAIEDDRLTLFDSSWPGQELMEIKHLTGKASVVLNRRHAFYQHIYEPVVRMADDKMGELTTTEIAELGRRIEAGIDLLLLAYAKAENLHEDPERKFGMLRSYWAGHLQSYVQQFMARTE
jgi:hypothetical protein